VEARVALFLKRWPKTRGLARRGVHAVNTPIARARLTRTLARLPRPLKLEIGGLASRPGWVVTNVNATTNLYLDATRPWPVETGAVEYVFADNVVEHIPLAGLRAMLEQAHRSMCAGGTIRLVTPDIRAHVDLYLAGSISLDSDVGRHYRRGGRVVEHPVDLIRIPIGEFGHHAGYVYDFDTLASELQKAGFRDCQRCAPGESGHPALVGLEARKQFEGLQLIIEATA
jgi:hypothetical protein